jgi:microcystin-dependent protein
MFGGNFAPRGWATCDGQLLAIAQNTALFSLLGTTYGGDGKTTFALPDLRGRVAPHVGNSLTLGQVAGSETVTLNTDQLPGHAHLANCANAATSLKPVGQYWSADPGQNVAPYNSKADGHAMSSTAIIPAGGGQPHDNMQPFLAISFIIALEGIFPPRN